jgi:hypothetical protein
MPSKREWKEGSPEEISLARRQDSTFGPLDEECGSEHRMRMGKRSCTGRGYSRLRVRAKIIGASGGRLAHERNCENADKSSVAWADCCRDDLRLAERSFLSVTLCWSRLRVAKFSSSVAGSCLSWREIAPRRSNYFPDCPEEMRAGRTAGGDRAIRQSDA